MRADHQAETNGRNEHEEPNARPRIGSLRAGFRLHVPVARLWVSSSPTRWARTPWPSPRRNPSAKQPRHWAHMRSSCPAMPTRWPHTPRALTSFSTPWGTTRSGCLLCAAQTRQNYGVSRCTGLAAPFAPSVQPHHETQQSCQLKNRRYP